ncbi:hypothetical protein VIBNISOn1_650008 [Vibrio nigripulchritudo SOn1]|uniref:Uncharacterized protein n=1 Tax=Vibrio nigripulchritudo SOn1 TaxID=1238450 RepID=A0AAV2VW23_9VIBR|nr:hypothetical protein VIBNISOn1_650008 [Vibrio nigripulchritudo SOn1]
MKFNFPVINYLPWARNPFGIIFSRLTTILRNAIPNAKSNPQTIISIVVIKCIPIPLIHEIGVIHYLKVEICICLTTIITQRCTDIPGFFTIKICFRTTKSHLYNFFEKSHYFNSKVLALTLDNTINNAVNNKYSLMFIYMIFINVVYFKTNILNV